MDDATLGGSPEVKAFFGEAYPTVAAFHSLLLAEGELRGLIGPREVDRLWERHLLNSAALAQYLPPTGQIADVGSGAGLPGVVLAAMRPDLQVRLIEPMERRCIWLMEAIEHLGLRNTEVLRGRAEEYHGAFEVDAVTARAVANLAKLSRLCLPLLRPGGELVVLKGRNVVEEIPEARKVLRKFKARDPKILPGATVPGVEETTVLRVSLP
ncbi:MAG: 16S rRNA (guanine(527)-N(7))-methyltransferase RsmG [Promicromonosporaceae bacterium]|nr:16S rRNA (guanine(527)-N(7))-methyltransferase RsmG [Promicromonosporaceae bacterium]